MRTNFFGSEQAMETSPLNQFWGLFATMINEKKARFGNLSGAHALAMHQIFLVVVCSGQRDDEC